jgi:small subunit ribosomal protein S9
MATSTAAVTLARARLRLAIARALVKVNAEDKKNLKDHGFLTRDSRAVERKKPGQPKARRRFQFSKR